MVSVFLNWAYIFVTVFLTGFGLCTAIYQFLGYRVRQISSVVAEGLILILLVKPVTMQIS
ncbi:MAG: hypothetical protein K2M91_14020 [Lachnospiraceae bacterium]|nr:hypothetical protein [Lachnospiraceae bacterium]